MFRAVLFILSDSSGKNNSFFHKSFLNPVRRTMFSLRSNCIITDLVRFCNCNNRLIHMKFCVNRDKVADNQIYIYYSMSALFIIRYTKNSKQRYLIFTAYQLEYCNIKAYICICVCCGNYVSNHRIVKLHTSVLQSLSVYGLHETDISSSFAMNAPLLVIAHISCILPHHFVEP